MLVFVEIIHLYLKKIYILFQGKMCDGKTPHSVSQRGVWLRAVQVRAESDSTQC